MFHAGDIGIFTPHDSVSLVSRETRLGTPLQRTAAANRERAPCNDFPATLRVGRHREFVRERRSPLRKIVFVRSGIKGRSLALCLKTDLPFASSLAVLMVSRVVVALEHRSLHAGAHVSGSTVDVRIASTRRSQVSRIHTRVDDHSNPEERPMPADVCSCLLF